MLPPKIPTQPKRSSRWRSLAHCNHVKRYACSNCGSTEGVQAAHVRFGSHTGMSQKPDDWRVVSLCHECHNGGGPTAQHRMGEPSFWAAYKKRTGQDVETLISAFIRTSPKRAEIERIQRERRQ